MSIKKKELGAIKRIKRIIKELEQIKSICGDEPQNNIAGAISELETAAYEWEGMIREAEEEGM